MTGLGRFLRRRLVAVPLTLVAVSVLVFALTAVVPGDVARRIVGREASPEAAAAVRADLGLDRPLVEQYGSWATGFVTGDWGTSYTRSEDVRPLVLDRLGQSLLLGGVAFAVLVPVALGLGLLAGARHGGRLDRAIGVSSVVGTATPVFVSGVVLLIVFAVQLRWFPTVAAAPPGSGLGEQLRRIVLPVVALVVLCAGYVLRMVRASTIATVESPYVRAAELRGLTRRQVVRRHVLRNALVPPLAALGVQLRWLIGGLVTVELLFSYPGIGALVVESAESKDVPTLQAAVLVLGTLVLATFVVTDLLYALLDPRIRLDGAAA